MYIKILFISFLMVFSSFAQSIYFFDGFEDGFNGYRWITNSNDACYSGGQVTVTNNPNNVISGNYSLEFNDQVGDLCTYVDKSMDHSVGKGDQIFWTFKIKYASNFRFTRDETKAAELTGDLYDRDNGARLIFMNTRNGDFSYLGIPSEDKCIPAFYNGGSGPGGWHAPNSRDGKYWGQNIDTNNPVYLEVGKWYEIKIFMKIDNNYSGVLKMWVNGKLILEHTDINTIMNGYDSQEYNTVRIGGQLNHSDGSNVGIFYQDTYHWWDDVSVTASESAPDTTAPNPPLNPEIFSE